MSTPQATNAQIEEYRVALQKIEGLHGNMAVLSRLGTLLKDPNTGIDDIGRLLQTDGALSTSVIRVSNSIQFGVGQKTTSLHDALIKVGFNRVISLLGAALSKQVFMKDLVAYGMTADEYWSYSYFCAVFLEGRAQRLGKPADEAYLVGLLHALGRVVINELLSKTHPGLHWNRTTNLDEWEYLTVGFKATDAGATLLRNWKLNPAVHVRVANQNVALARAADPLLIALDYARTCAELNKYRLETNPWILPADHAIMQSPDFNPNRMADEIEQAQYTCRQVRDALKRNA